MAVGGFTSRQAADLVGFRPARVRAMARAGILTPDRGPHRQYRFTFQDLVLLRSARALLDSPLPCRRVHRALRHLVRQLPTGRRPSEVSLRIEGRRVVARDGDLNWTPEDGQLLLEFDPRIPTPASRALEPRGPVEDEAEGWFQQGLDLEPFDMTGAEAAYRQALASDPAHPGAHVALGRLVQARGEVMEAVRHYRSALETDPCHATAAFNLGTALEAVGLLDEAISTYRLAISVSPSFAEAHYNLSRLYEAAGQKLPALVHLKRYRELVSRN